LKKVFYIIFGFLILFASTDVQAQFISNKGKPEGKYLNYSGRNYENYSTTFIRKKFFDNFGNFLIEGTTIYELNEVQRQSASGYDEVANSDIIKSRFYQNYFNNLVIGNDSYSGFQTRLMVGDAIRTEFTPLTFKKARFNGLRWDLGTSKYRGTIVASRISDPIRFRFDQNIYIEGVRRLRDWTQYLFGGHFETDIGDVLTVGFTYMNQHQRRSSLDSKNSSIEGVVSSAIPRVIFLKISDDSPDDGSGPIIFNTPQIIINGQPRQLINLYRQKPTKTSTTLEQPIQYYCLRDNIRNKAFDIDQVLYTGIDTSSFSMHTFYSGVRYGVPPPQYPYQIAGASYEGITYAFVIPEGTYSVQFQMLLANDFKIETAHDFVYNVNSGNMGDDYRVGGGYRYAWEDSIAGYPTPFFVRKRADGNVKDGSNKQLVTIDYGLTTGMSVYGLNFSLNWNGLNIEGEFDESVEFMKYPLLAGNRYESKGRAWYLRGKKKFGRLTIGGERYYIAPTYTTSLNTFVLENSYFSEPNVSSIIPTAYNAPDFLGYDVNYTLQRKTIFPGGAFYPLVDDNDDNDRWEDGFYFYNATDPDLYQRNRDVLNPRSDFFKLGYRQNVNELRSLDAIIRQPDTGIFPGKDKDNDGIPDDDRNANGVPDYSEDFLTYYADPPSFEFGDDWNNNGVIDEQENDILPDYPYEPDINGYHIFNNLEILEGWNLGIGKIHEEAIARGGKNDVNYVKSSYSTETPRFGALRLFYVMKQVRDHIPNNGYQYQGVITTSNPFPSFVQDPMNYRNSLVNSFFIGTKYTQIPNLVIENNVRVEFNNQFKVGDRDKALLTEAKLLGDQVPGSIVLWGIVNKIDYTMTFFDGSLKLSPQFKVRTEKVISTKEDQTGIRVINIDEHQQEIIPIIRVDYKLTEATDFRFGLQGFKLFGNAFMYRIRNFKDNIDSQDRSTVAVSLSNRTQFSGYNVVFDFGYKFTKIDFLREEDSKKGTQESTIFFTIFAGF